MRLILTHLGEASPFELAEGRHTVGGAAEDAVSLAPLPPSLLTLTVEGERLGVEAHGPVLVDGVPLPPGLPRLLLPGETLTLPEDVTLLRPVDTAPAPRGTASIFLHLLEEAEAAAPPGAPTLTCLTGPEAGRVHVLSGARVLLGRAPDVDVRLRDRAVSRHHAHLRWEAGRCVVEDLGGPNGVLVNGQRVGGAVPLHSGDVLELGQTHLRFHAPGEPGPPEAGALEPGSRALRPALVLGAVLVLGALVALGGALVALGGALVR